jgi:hypothetical protein
MNPNLKIISYRNRIEKRWEFRTHCQMTSIHSVSIHKFSVIQCDPNKTSANYAVWVGTCARMPICVRYSSASSDRSPAYITM